MPATPPSNPWFRLVVVSGGLFAFTVMSMLAATFGDPKAPPNRFFNAYGIPLVLVETVAVVAISVKALAVDRRQTLEQQAARRAEQADEKAKSSLS
jgi:hypothetical protein